MYRREASVLQEYCLCELFNTFTWWPMTFPCIFNHYIIWSESMAMVLFQVHYTCRSQISTAMCTALTHSHHDCCWHLILPGALLGNRRVVQSWMLTDVIEILSSQLSLATEDQQIHLNRVCTGTNTVDPPLPLTLFRGSGETNWLIHGIYMKYSV